MRCDSTEANPVKIAPAKSEAKGQGNHCPRGKFPRAKIQHYPRKDRAPE